MFKLEGNLKFVNIDMNYLKYLHETCSEVFYKPNNYDNKPYLGVLLSNGDRKYVLPLTSAKEKHRLWKDSYPDRFLIYALERKELVSQSAIYKETEDDGIVKHILSAVDIKKMIPVVDNVILPVDINIKDEDSEKTKKYKTLLNKEYSFCVKIMDSVLYKASRIYDKQIDSGKVQKFSCDFKALESASDSWHDD
ncbi:MAG: type III toxin-antitoxin system ToxN/AbiQ family toxin [Lachnospiraceae bacterium]|nr:type III toxin-antitoxin system ToxN/AbiQ family toxin [Lachnospiraceae bacterium]